LNHSSICSLGTKLEAAVQWPKDASREMINPPLPTQTLHRARRLRSELTEAEKRLWSHLRSRQIRGLKFRRQHPIPPYIADFCCIEKKLIIELDGSQHGQQVDEARSQYLERRGWKVVRYWDNDVLCNTESVLEAIWNFTA
jgi:very-short-patch-repair endonuclease